MGLLESDEEYAVRHKRIADSLVTPKDSSLPLREMMEEHLVTLVKAHNGAVADKLHFLATREIRGEAIAEWAPYVTNPAPAWLTRNIESHKVDVEEIVHAATGSLGFRLIGDDMLGLLAKLGNAHLIEVYGRVLLFLRGIVLPDPSDIS